MKINVNYVECRRVYEMCEVQDFITKKKMIVNVGGRYLPF